MGRIFAAALSLSLIACVPSGGQDGSGGGTSPDGQGGSDDGTGTDGGTSTSILGTYQGEQAWDLSELTVLDGGGDAVSALVVAEVVDATGLPSFVQDDAADVIDGLIGDAVAELVDRQIGDAGVVADLTGILGTARLGTRLTLEARDGQTVTGQEELTSVILSHDGQDHHLGLGSMLSVVGYDRALAEVSADLSAADTVLEVADHDYILRVDTIVEVAGVEVLGYETLEAGLAPIIDCDALLTEITGADGEVGISVAGYDVTVTTEDLSGVCSSARVELTDFILDFFRTDAGVAAGGSLQLSPGALSSTDYSGAITFLPTGVDPSFDIDYQVARID